MRESLTTLILTLNPGPFMLHPFVLVMVTALMTTIVPESADPRREL